MCASKLPVGVIPVFKHAWRHCSTAKWRSVLSLWAELELGAHLSPKGYARARAQIEVFSLLPQWPFDRASAERYAELRADLQRQGQLIGGHDMQIAAIALVHGLILVTHNTREFSRVSGLRLEDWQDET